MRAPLEVRIDDGHDVRHVTAQAAGLRFTRTAFGGDKDLSVRMQTARGTFTDLGPGDSIEVYDPTGRIWSGNVDNPGQTSGPAGDSYDLTSFGGAARLNAAKTPLGYVLDDLSLWERSPNSTKGAQTTTETKRDGTDTLEVSANEGKNVGPTWQGGWRMRALAQAGLQVARVQVSVDAGVASTNYTLHIRTGPSIDSVVSRASVPASTSGAVVAAAAVPTGEDVAELLAARGSTSVVATDDHWFRFSDVVVRSRLLDVNGNNINVGYGANTVYAHEVIADMVGRGMAPGADPAKVSIGLHAATEYPIDSLHWLDGVTFADAMSDLRVFEPDLWWMLSGDALTVGLWDAENPRYVISKADGGIRLPGQEFTLCNRIAVSWTDRKGRDQVTVVTVPVEGLDYTRDAEPITLPQGRGSEANAQRAGLQALALANDPPRAGTAVVRRRIVDRWGGCPVWPHEIEPGCVVVEQETGDTFRLTETEYLDNDAATVLTLGEPVRTPDQIVQRLHKLSKRKR